MDIKELCEKASENARNKGFWDIADYMKDAEEHHCLDCDDRPCKDQPTPVCYFRGKLTLVWQSNCLMQIVAEAAEALEALRNNDMENHIEEIADMFIRLGDYCGNMGIDIVPAIEKKMKKNLCRERVHGKRF